MVPGQENWFVNFPRYWTRLQNLSISPGASSSLLAALITVLCSKKKNIKIKKEEEERKQPWQCHLVSSWLASSSLVLTETRESQTSWSRRWYFTRFSKQPDSHFRNATKGKSVLCPGACHQILDITCHRQSESQGTVYTLTGRGPGAFLCLVLKACG